ncbi:DUF4381 domain-containing protein [Ferrimonas gelatinilytica]|uniref:DUF4381 domain-containing protein n=1 Tax=Ferrimonas gelatinilytica TaxID=1255257 RepID=A0ABP9S4H5_9GAMM
MNPLEQLHDIQLPAPVSHWPPAWGWWCLLALILVSLGAIAYALWRRHQYRRPLRQTLAQLQQLDANDPTLPTQLQALIKRCALAYTPREAVAALHGEQWHQYLNTLYPTDWPALLGNPYRPPALSTHEGQRLLVAAAQALKALPKQHTGVRHAES